MGWACGWWLVADQGGLDLPRLASILLPRLATLPRNTIGLKYVDLYVDLSIHYSYRLSNAAAAAIIRKIRTPSISCLAVYLITLSLSTGRKYDSCHIWSRAHHDPRSPMLAKKGFTIFMKDCYALASIHPI